MLLHRFGEGSKSGLFAHFQSKENLEVAILEEAIRRFVALVVTPALHKPRRAARPRALRSVARLAEGGFPARRVHLRGGRRELDDRPGPARDALVAAQKDWIDTLALAARIGVDEGHFRKDLDAGSSPSRSSLIAVGYLFSSA